MNRVRFGIIGAGNMGSYHAHLLRDAHVPRAELTAVADIDPTRLEPYRSLATYGSGEELIASGPVDAVLIATPHYAHTTLGMAALRAGLHVLVEKPISVHKADCERLLAVPRRAGQVFGAMFNQRTDPYYRKIRELVRGGELGELCRLSWIITDWFRTEAYYASGDWRATWAGEGGGVLLNQATHNLDLFQWMFGMPVRVRAVCGLGRFHQIEVEDDVTALLEFANGATGVFVTTTGEAPGVNRLEVVGDRGRLLYEQDRLHFIQNAVPTSEFRRQSPKHYAKPATHEHCFQFPDHGGQHVAILKNFVAAILDGAPLLAPADEGVGAVELANAMLWSSARNEPVNLPLDSAGYARYLQQLIASSTYRKQVIRPTETEVVPYLVTEN